MTEKSELKFNVKKFFFKLFHHGKHKGVSTDLYWEKSNFLSNMSHEIRTPLNVIISMSELLSESQELSDKDWDYANMIYSASRNLLDILDDILDYSQYTSGKYDLVNQSYSPSEMISDIEKIVSPNAKSKKLNFSVSIDPRVPNRMIGDAERIKQIILNLLDNAVKYTDVGFCELKVGYRPLDDKRSQLLFIVSDSGIGIKDDDLKRIFDEFAQIDPKKKKKKEGTGLGLAIARQLCELMGGNINVTSEYGKGSTFIATVIQEISPEADVEDKKISLSDLKEIGNFIAPDFKVLAVDDNNINLKVIVELLKRFGITADTAESGERAIELISNNKYNLVFMDYVMPEMDGKDATIKIRTLDGCAKNELPIVALTADVNIYTKEELLESGMNDYLAKPVISDELNVIIRKYVPLDLRHYL